MKKVEWQERSALDAPEYPKLAEKFGLTVPLIIKGEQGMVGYNIGRLNEIINS